MNRMILVALAAALAVIGSACSIEVERNADGSLQIATTITEASLQREITAAMADPLVHDVEVDLADGFVQVDAERDEVFGNGTAHVGFRLDLDVVDDHLGAVVSDAEIGGEPIPAEIVEIWNERLAFQLERAGRQNPDSTLASVTVAGDQLQMEWRVETDQSRS